MATAGDPGFDSGKGLTKGEPLKPSYETQMSETDGSHVSKVAGGAVPKDRKQKIGHRRVDEKTGTVTYKKKPTSELMAAIQLGIGQSIGGLSSKPERDLLMQDFGVVQSVVFPSEGSNLTPAHHYSDFRFKTYAPVAFRYFRELFNIRPDDFMLSLCDDPLTELSNPGAGGSIFYITEDDEFIIKTAQHKEADFLQKLLPGYYMNLNQNPRTLLPKFYGLYCYQCGGKNIRFVVMNNILPSTVKMHEKYDLKGSTYKRKASKNERAKSSPTLKDLDFLESHPEGLMMEKETYEALIKTIQRDCRVLESFKIMDYSMLVGIHNLDMAAREKGLTVLPALGNQPGTSSLSDSQGTTHNEMAADGKTTSGISLQRGKSIRTKVTQYSTPMESIHVEVKDTAEDFSDEDIPPGGIPAKNYKGERLLLYLGIIDILQRYRLKKKFEHTFKSMIIDGETISVTRPSFYSERFQNFFKNTVFQKAPSLEAPTFKASQRFRKLVGLALKHSPSKRKPGGPPDRPGRTISMTEDVRHIPGTVGGRPDLLIGSSTPPPTFDEALQTGKRSDQGYFQPIPQQEIGMTRVQITHSPLSVSESTPTCTEFTEGTPSYTASSPSCSSEVLDTAVPSLPLEIDGQAEIHESLPGSPTRAMMASTSTDTSFVSAVSTQDVLRNAEDKQGPGHSVEISVQPFGSASKHSGNGADISDQPRVSVVSDKSTDTSTSEQSEHARSTVSGFSESVTSKNSSQSVTTDSSAPTSTSGAYRTSVSVAGPAEQGSSTVIDSNMPVAEVDESTHL